MDEKKTKAPETGPNGVDRWTSNGYGLCIDGVTVTPPEEREDSNGNEAQEYAPDER